MHLVDLGEHLEAHTKLNLISAVCVDAARQKTPTQLSGAKIPAKEVQVVARKRAVDVGWEDRTGKEAEMSEVIEAELFRVL